MGNDLERELYDLRGERDTALRERDEAIARAERVAALALAVASPKPAPAQIAAEAEDWSQEAAEALRRTAPAVSHADADRAIVEADA